MKIQGQNGGIYNLIQLVQNGNSGLFGTVRKASVVRAGNNSGANTGDFVAVKELCEARHKILTLPSTPQRALEHGIFLRLATRKVTRGEDITLEHVNFIRPEGRTTVVAAVDVEGELRELSLTEYMEIFGLLSSDAPSKWQEFTIRVERLCEERKMMEAAPDHPNLLPLLDWAELINDNQIRVFLVLPLCECDLLDHLLSEKPTATTARGYFADVSSGVSALHRAGIAHRDIKCDNIFVDRDDNGAIRLRLGDFGAATRTRMCGEKTPLPLYARIGTPMTMAPEVTKQTSDTDEPLPSSSATDGYCGERADSWSLGVVLFQMLMHRDVWLTTPFGPAKMRRAMSPDAGFNALKNKSGTLPSAIPAGAQRVILQLLTVDAANRLVVGDALDDPWVAEHNANDNDNTATANTATQ